MRRFIPYSDGPVSCVSHTAVTNISTPPYLQSPLLQGRNVEFCVKVGPVTCPAALLAKFIISRQNISIVRHS